jgi:hypothetical protein
MTKRKTIGGLKLIKYLERKDLKITKFFEQNMDVAYNNFYGWLNGAFMPSLDAAVKIQELTGGFVRCEDWVNYDSN